MGDQDQETSERQDDLFYAFAQIILTRLKVFVEPLGGMPVRTRYYVSFAEDCSSHTSLQTKTDYRTLLLHYQHQAFLEDETRLQEFIQQQEEFTSHALSAYAIVFLNNFLLLDAIRDALERYNTLDLTRDQLLESYHRYRDFWAAPSIRYKTVIPLLNFSSDVTQEITVGTTMVLSPFTPDEKTQLWNSDVDYYPNVLIPIEYNAFLRSRYKLACTHLQEQNKEYSTEEINKELLDVLTALRLTKAGNVGAPAIFENSELYSMAMGTPMITRTDDYDVRQSGAEYGITEAELSQVTSLYANLQRLNSLSRRGGLVVALRRFNRAYSREIGEDKIIDLTIALESCLLAGETKELSYRFALRGAALLSKSKDPKETKKLLKAIYDARSSIVHDGKTLAELKRDNRQTPSGHATQEFLRQSEELARDILREYIIQMSNRHLPVKEFNNQLENLIIEHLTSTEQAGE